jgi:hypothetical protein
MNNQFLQHLNSITPQGRAKDTNIFVPAEDIQEVRKPNEKDAKKLLRKLKKAGRAVKRVVGGVVNTLGTPQDNTDYMITGRKF